MCACSTWEGGIRVPGIAYYPGKIKPGRVTEAIAGTMDLFVTTIKLANGTVPTDRVIDGKDISDIIFYDGDKSPHQFLFHHGGPLVYAVRYGAYKAHYVTHDGYDPQPPVHHDPPMYV